MVSTNSSYSTKMSMSAATTRLAGTHPGETRASRNAPKEDFQLFLIAPRTKNRRRWGWGDTRPVHRYAQDNLRGGATDILLALLSRLLYYVNGKNANLQGKQRRIKMNKKSTVVFILVAMLILSTFSIALAVTYGEPDEDGHPYVGLAFFYDENEEYMWRCSGTLIDPKVFVTAGHCTFGTTKAVVLFDSDLEDILYVEEGDRGYIFGEYGKHKHYDGDPNAHPDYIDYWTDFPNTHDVGVVVLKNPANLTSFGTLPNLGTLDQAADKYHKKDIIIRTVGYGVQSVKPYDQSEKIRYTSTSNLVNLKSANNDGYNVQTSNNPSVVHGMGGACFGDSGGPLFYPEDSNVMVAIVSFGMNWNCKGEDWSYRADISTTQDFINSFLVK
jgi:hypothetical protein